MRLKVSEASTQKRIGSMQEAFLKPYHPQTDRRASGYHTCQKDCDTSVLSANLSTIHRGIFAQIVDVAMGVGKVTKELAIKILSTRDRYGCLCGWTSGYTGALDMAIEAL